MEERDRDLEARLGYRFRDPRHLLRALTPPSSGLADHNQRMEFLGDALLNAAVARLVFEARGDWDEGAMSKLRASLVSTSSLAAWADDLGLELHRGPRSPKAPPGGKARADAVEALLCAVHLDAGARGFEAVLEICRGRFLAAIRSADARDWRMLDAKTALQEQAAAQGLPAPDYRLTGQEGPDHAPSFEAEVRLGSRLARGEGRTRKAAEAEAARRMLEDLGG